MLIVHKDPLYNSFWLLKFLNKIIRAGKKGKILKHIYIMFFNNKLNLDLELMFMECLEILRVPLVLKRLSKKREIPYPISPYYQYKQGLCWFVNSIKKKKKNINISIKEEIFSIISLNTNCLSLKQKRNHEQLLYKQRFYKNFSNTKF